MKRIARSGSLIERVEHVGGVPKTVIETTSSSEEDDGNESGGSAGKNGDGEARPLLGR
jgi:metal transporter CNNM